MFANGISIDSMPGCMYSLFSWIWLISMYHTWILSDRQPVFEIWLEVLPSKIQTSGSSWFCTQRISDWTLQKRGVTDSVSCTVLLDLQPPLVSRFRLILRVNQFYHCLELGCLGLVLRLSLAPNWIVQSQFAKRWWLHVVCCLSKN